MACWTKRSRRSSSWPSSGARSTAPIASLRTAAPTCTGCGCRRPASTGCWSPTTWCCPPPPPGHPASANLGRTGSTIDPIRCGAPDVTHFGRCRAAPCSFAIIDLAGPQVAGHPAQRRGDLHAGRGGVHRRAGGRGLQALVAARQDGRVDLAQDDPTRPLLLAVSDNAPADDLRVDQGVPGVVLDRPALRPPAYSHRPGPDRELLRPRQGRVAPPGTDPRPRRAPR